jgi:hypothetical protein
MWNVVFLLFVAAGALAVAHFWIRFRNATAGASPKPARRPPATRAPNARPAAAPLAPLAWDGVPVEAGQPAKPADTRERVRDRYIAARFPGLVTCAADLEQVDEVVRMARLCHEEDRDDLAHELLALAIERLPESETLRLAQIEFAFLRRSSGRFVACAADFRRVLPQSRNWNEIARLGRVIAPGHALFATATPIQPVKHYGPWPDLPNWIQASWDFTSEVLAADLHRNVLRSGPNRAVPKTDRIALGA